MKNDQMRMILMITNTKETDEKLQKLFEHPYVIESK